jgi:hypothetical protein
MYMDDPLLSYLVILMRLMKSRCMAGLAMKLWKG